MRNCLSRAFPNKKRGKKSEKPLDVIVPQISAEGTFPELVPTACQHSGVSAQGGNISQHINY